MDVVKAIEIIKQRKTAQKRHPTHAIKQELLAEGCTMDDIRNAVKSGLIEYGKTLNSFYFKIKYHANII